MTMQFQERTALVTGAASGIGRAVAISLAQRGANLILVDIDTVGLNETHRQLKAGVRASLHTVDLADGAAITELARIVSAEHRALDLLFNVAGVAMGGAFDQITEADYDWLTAINYLGTVRMVRVFLPLLRKAEEARIVNVSSIYGIVSPPGQSAYSASKFAVRGFSNALRNELRGTNVGVSVVHPGGVATAIADSARTPAGLSVEEVSRHRAATKRLLKMPPVKAGEIIVEAVAARKSRILVGTDAKIAALLERLMPVSHFQVLEWLTRRSR